MENTTNNTVEVNFEDDDEGYVSEEVFSVKKDGIDLMCFTRDETISDTYYSIIYLLTSLGFDVISEGLT
jgi:hypothetical protein